jgi:hypothetical protein
MTILKLLTMVFLAVASGWAQAPDGRWDGTITYGRLKIPFTIHFEPNGKALTGSFVNGDTRVSSTEGSFEAGLVRLTFGASGTRLEATLANEDLEGTYGSGGQDMHPVTASKFCPCGSEGDAGTGYLGNLGGAGLHLAPDHPAERRRHAGHRFAPGRQVGTDSRTL